jgi:hypothetical protein
LLTIAAIDVSLLAGKVANAISAVKPMHRALIRAHTWFAVVTDPLKKLFSTQTQRHHSASPRMCPFCGLITPRSKSSCMECGKSLRGVQLARKDAKQG